MPWWVKLTRTDESIALYGPHDDETAAQTEADQLETDGQGTCDAPYEADADEPSRFPRPYVNRLTKDGFIEVWTDGTTRTLT